MTSSYDKDWFQDPPDLAPSSYEPPYNPLDSMPIANGSNKYADPKRQMEIEAIIEQNPRPEEDMAEWFKENPEESDEIEKEKTMHQKMYELATQNGTTLTLGGSENASRV